MADVDGSTEALIEHGRAAFPEVTASRDALAPLVAQRLQGEDQPAQLDREELFLACACALGDGAAITALERRYFGVIPAALSRLSLGRDEIAEVEQILRVRLFVADAEEGALPRVVSYAGHGKLGGLLRVAAVRAGLNLLRDRGRLDYDAEDGLEDVPIATDDPELARLKAQHRTAFKAAFEEAVASLAPRERSLLDLSTVKRLGIDKIAAIYSVHRATAARWVTGARDNLTRAVHRILGQRLGLREGELENLLPLVESQIELSLERLLASRSEPAT
jgi:RNA polymerase sigma-70 factor (ECF subfamily)